MLTIRRARDEDAAALIRIVGACWDEYPGCVTDIDGEAPELRALASHMAAKDGCAWAAEVDGGVAGLVACWPASGGFEVGKMYVAGAHRGNGAASALLTQAEVFARERKAPILMLWSDTRFTRAHGFYERHGFLRTGPLRALGDRSHSVEFGYAKPLSGTAIRVLDAAAAGSAERGLARILLACVDGGASVSFMAPLSGDAARAFWRGATSAVAAGRRIVVVAWFEGVLSGVVTLDCDTPPNQPHRAEVQKLLVHPEARGRGLARALMTAAEGAARQAGRTLLTLDTQQGSAAERLYRSIGYVEAGRIPGYALDPAGQGRHATVLFYKDLA